MRIKIAYYWAKRLSIGQYIVKSLLRVYFVTQPNVTKWAKRCKNWRECVITSRLSGRFSVSVSASQHRIVRIIANHKKLSAADDEFKRASLVRQPARRCVEYILSTGAAAPRHGGRGWPHGRTSTTRRHDSALVYIHRTPTTLVIIAITRGRSDHFTNIILPTVNFDIRLRLLGKMIQQARNLGQRSSVRKLLSVHCPTR